MNQARKFGCLAILWLIACSKLGAQVTAPPARGKASPSSAPTFKVDVDLVLVEVGVHDEHGRAAGNLQAIAFGLFAGGRLVGSAVVAGLWLGLGLRVSLLAG